ncbi:hypothetical protein ACFLV7_12015 [Chloroflexota bacterium]
MKKIYEFSLDQIHQLWQSAEAISSPELSERKRGFERLIEFDVVRKSQLIVYLLATRIVEPDLTLRAYIVRVLAGILKTESPNNLSPEDVRITLVNYLSQIGKREILALLQLAEIDPYAEEQIINLLCACSCAGGHLINITNDRGSSLSIRKLSLKFIGRVGYLEALPDLLRLETRLKAKTKSNHNEDSQTSLLPLITEALTLLQTP